MPVPTPVPAPFPRPVHPTRRILVVDDNVDAADMLAVLLEELGNEICVSHGALDALAKASTFAPDVAVLDIGLPEMDGYELARRLRALPGGSRTRLIALSGYGQASDKERSANAGFDAHLVKPISLAELQSKLSID